MENNYTPTLFKPDYLLKEFLDLLNNNPKSAHRFMQNLMNVDYDFINNTGFYKILNEEQRKLLDSVYQLRKKDENFDMNFKKMLMITAAAIGLGYAIAKLLEHLDNKREMQFKRI